MLSDSDVEILTSQPSRRSLRIAIADSLDETSRDFQEYGREEDYEDYLDQKVEDIVSIEATPRFEPGMKRKRTTPLSDSKPGLLLEREKDRKPRVFDIANTESKPKRLASVCDSTPISTPLTPGASAAGTSIENSDSHGGIPAAEILNELLAVETGASPATLLRHLVRENMRQERNVVDLQRMNAELRERIRSIESDIGRSRQGA